MKSTSLFFFFSFLRLLNIIYLWTILVLLVLFVVLKHIIVMLNSNSVAFSASPLLFTKHLPHSFASLDRLSTLHRRHIHHPHRDYDHNHSYDYDHDHVHIPSVRHRLRHILLPAGDVNVTRCMSQTSRYGGASEDTSAQQENQSAVTSNLNSSSNSNTDPKLNSNLNPSDPATVTSAGRPNVNKYKSQRSVLSCEKRDVTAEEVNALMVKAGKLVCYDNDYIFFNSCLTTSTGRLV